MGPLDKLEGSYIQKIEWDDYLNPSILLELDDLLYRLSFSGVSLFHTAVQRNSNIYDANEIWKIEEPEVSHKKRNIFLEKGIYWLKNTINNYYQRSHMTKNPNDIKHVIISSDYIDIEILCLSCTLQPLHGPMPAT